MNIAVRVSKMFPLTTAVSRSTVGSWLRPPPSCLAAEDWNVAENVCSGKVAATLGFFLPAAAFWEPAAGVGGRHAGGGA